MRGIALIDIVDQLKDGIALAHLVEIAFALDIMEGITKKQPLKPKDKIKNLQHVFRSLSRVKLELPQRISPEEVMNGNISVVLELLWHLFLKIEGKHLSPAGKTSPSLEDLKAWCKEVTSSYKELTQRDDIFQSFKEGRLLCVILNQFAPNTLDVRAITNSTKDYNRSEFIQKSMDAAEKLLGVVKLFDATEIDQMDDTCIVMYLLLLNSCLKLKSKAPSSSSSSGGGVSSPGSKATAEKKSGPTAFLSITFKGFPEVSEELQEEGLGL